MEIEKEMKCPLCSVEITSNEYNLTIQLMNEHWMISHPGVSLREILDALERDFRESYA